MAPQISMVSVAKLRPDPRNARIHSKKQLRQIANSIGRFGWTYPILADESGRILAGHGRYQAAQLLGFSEIPVITLSHLGDAEKRALVIADNKIAENAGWDREILAAELGELAVVLPQVDLTLDITGFEPAEIDGLLGDLVDCETDPADVVGEIATVAVSRPGDLWSLGRHRVLCGNATSPDDVMALLDGEQAAMVFTDPPYNLRARSIQGRGSVKHKDFIEAFGEMSPDEFTAFLSSSLGQAANKSMEGSIHYVCMDWRHLNEMLAAGRNVFSELKNVVVWNKTNAGQGSFYRSQHEFIFVFKSGDAANLNNVELGKYGRNRSNVWTYPGVNTFRAGRMDDLAAHPTVKPAQLVADAMRDCTRRGDIVLDPFLGSGTTILAAERVGRKGYGIELNPLYVDAAIRRWQNFTKRDATLVTNGQTFDEVAAARSSLTGD
jgi:DNA modification methylase